MNDYDFFTRDVLKCMIKYLSTAVVWSKIETKIKGANRHIEDTYFNLEMQYLLLKYGNNSCNCLPVSQCFPMYPDLQLQRYVPERLIQAAPFLHGLFSHSFISVSIRRWQLFSKENERNED